jgi:23S rRNA A2030 N6-methylase RlmJ
MANEKDFEPNQKMEEVMQGLGKEPGRISGMLNITKLWYWIKNRKNAKRLAQSGMEGKEK